MSEDGRRHTVPDDAPKMRLDQYASTVFPRLPSRASARKAAHRGEVLLNGEPAESSRWITAGDVLELLEGQPPTPRQHGLAVAVAYEDDLLAVVDKPPGIHVSGNRSRTLEGALPGKLSPSAQPDALPFPRAAHRLDRRTGGLVVVAKTSRCLMKLGHLFQQRQVHKRYRALVVGRLEGEGTVELEVDDRAAVTRWQAVEHTRCLKCDWLTTVDLWPSTGRMHQLRKHMASLGCPVLGDDLYGIEGQILWSKGLYLRALELRFDHPLADGEVHTMLEEPAKFGSHLLREQRRWERVHSA